MRKPVSGIMLTLLVLGMLTLSCRIQSARAEPRTWTVDDDPYSGLGDFWTIIDAIDAASPGDTIYVYNGTYNGSHSISKSLTIIGENKHATIITGPGYGSAVTISDTHDVILAGFTIRNAETGISIYQSLNNTIANNVITDNVLGGSNWGGGISLEYSDNNTIVDNVISNTTEVGIYHHYSSHNTEARNVISRNDAIEMPDPIGIFLGDYCFDNTILGNNITKYARGVYAGQLAYNNTFSGNIITNLTTYGACGINIWGPDNRITDNTISNMGYVGIQLNSYSSDGLYGVPNACANNVVSGNTISNSTFGINLILAAFSNTVVGNNLSDNSLGVLLGDQSDNNTIIGNLISNSDSGILLFSSNNTKVYHNNLIENAQQVVLSESFNTAWDNGYPLPEGGGNFWSDYAGPDADSDGLGDTPYIIDPDNQDNYPLMTQYVGHDVAVTDILPAETIVRNGLNMSIEVTVENHGDYTETFNITIYADTIVIATFTNITMASKSSLLLALDWNTSGFAGAYVLSVDVIPVANETDLSDNRLVYGIITISCAGDINLDYITDGKDFVLVKKAMGSTQGSPRWNSGADLNADGSVSVQDYQIVKNHIPSMLP